MAGNKGKPGFQSMYDLPLMQMISRLEGIRHEFKKIAFIGPNPYLFLLNNPYRGDNIEFTFIENTKESAEKSFEVIEKVISQGLLEKKGVE